MRKLLTLLIFFIAIPAAAQQFSSDILGDVRLHYDSITKKPVTATIDDITLYVRSTGNDNNTCLTSGNACLTIQEAVDRVPKQIGHNVTVDVGEGSFSGMQVSGFIVKAGEIFTLGGVLGNPTLGGGTVSGTADGGSTTQCIDSGQAWVANELRGRLVLVGAEYRVVRNNDGTTMNLVGALVATCNGKTYELFEQKTVIDTAGIESTVNVNDRSGLVLKDMKITGVTYGAAAMKTDGMSFLRLHVASNTIGYLLQTAGKESIIQDCYSTGNTYGFYMLNAGYVRKFERNYSYSDSLKGAYFVSTTKVVGNDFYADNTSGVTSDGLSVVFVLDFDVSNIVVENCVDNGIYVAYTTSFSSTPLVASSNGGYGVEGYAVPHFNFGNVAIESNTSDGMHLAGLSFVDIDSGTISSNGGYGVNFAVDSGAENRFAFGTLNMYGTITVENNTLGGIIVKNRGGVGLTNVDGTNTGAYGLELRTGATATITSATGITGAVGDATINDGTTTLTWAVHFNDNGDTAINARNLSVIERKD